MADTNFDVIIIGGGPGGYVTAIRAAQLGFKTCVVEREHLGGICLNWGCIPTKALLRSAEVYHNMHTPRAYGLKASKAWSFDLKKVVERSRGVSKQLNRASSHLMKKNKVTVIDGARQTERRRQGRRHGSQGRQRHGHLHRQAHHRRHRRPPARAAGDRAGRQADLDLFRSDGPGTMPKSCW
jgi:pyruvate/2-oxoglutarate dehydrogenase complex dihydrolipoamide dehydrogenase (E3) component